MEDLLTFNQMAAAAGVHVTQVRTMVREGLLNAYRRGPRRLDRGAIPVIRVVAALVEAARVGALSRGVAAQIVAEAMRA